MLREFEISLLSRPHRACATLLVLTSDGFDTAGPRLYRQFDDQRSGSPPQDPLELDPQGTFASAPVSPDFIDHAEHDVKTLVLPLATHAVRTLGETRHVLRIDSEFVSVDLHWGSKVPDGWSALSPLLTRLEALVALLKS